MRLCVSNGLTLTVVFRGVTFRGSLAWNFMLGSGRLVLVGRCRRNNAPTTQPYASEISRSNVEC